MSFIRNNKILTKKIKKRWYILEKNKKIVRELNEVASFIWELLKSPHTVDELVNKVCKEYKVTKEQSKKDIQKFILNYVKKGYILQTK